MISTNLSNYQLYIKHEIRAELPSQKQRIESKLINWFYGWSNSLFEESATTNSTSDLETTPLAELQHGDSLEWEINQTPRDLIPNNLIYCFSIFYPSFLSSWIQSLKHRIIFSLMEDELFGDEYDYPYLMYKDDEIKDSGINITIATYSINNIKQCHTIKYQSAVKGIVLRLHKILQTLQASFYSKNYHDFNSLPVFETVISTIYNQTHGHGPPNFKLNFAFSRRI